MTEQTNGTGPSRRSFLEMLLAGGAVSFATAGAALLPVATPARAGAAKAFHFPQGLASGDPTPTGIVLWTRVEAKAGATPLEVPLTLQVSEGEDFATVVLERKVAALAANDHTARVVVSGLKPDRVYHYRFLAPDGAVPEYPGRTRTAPAPDADRPVRLAFVSCQSFEDGFYGAYRTLVAQDKAAAPDAQVDFVLHLGDQIYETVGYGKARTLPPLPSGGGETKWGPARHALTLEDFRHIWRAYLSDPDYRAARARFPFVCIWDDHEFVNDYWQTTITFTPEGKSAQTTKLAANKAWFEFVPALLTGVAGVKGVKPAAHDFKPASVVDTDARTAPVNDDNLLQEPNNLAALDSLCIYRSFRWGRHLELVLTDTRSYRSDHAVPDDLGIAIGGQATYLLPQPLVQLMDAGRTANGGKPPATIRIGDKDIPNPRKDSPPGTLLGGPQKAWLKQTLAGSDATWKVLATSVPFLPMRIDMGSVDPGKPTLVLTADAWDGFPKERRELMTYLRSQKVGNVISLSGDHHQSFAGLVHDDFEGKAPVPAAVEFSVTGISSTPVWQGFARAVKDDSPLKPLVAQDGTAFGRPGPVESLNLTLRHGTKAAVTAAKTGDLKAGLAASNPAQNPHLRYVDTNCNGFGLLRVDGSGAVAELVATTPARQQPGPQGGVLRRARFAFQPWGPDGVPVLPEPEVEGEKPFPLA